MLKTNTKAPTFNLNSTDGKIYSLKDSIGKYVVLYFYPKDDTPGCTKEAIEFSDNSDFSLFIPEGFAHGFLCLSKTCTIYYKCTNYRDQKSEITIKWDDKNLKIKWPVRNPILSKKDRLGTSLSDY